MEKIGILYVATGRYIVFWETFCKSAEKFLFVDPARYEKKYFVFTDKPSGITPAQGIQVIEIKKEPWPFPTLKRWHYFLKSAESWRGGLLVFF